MQYLASQRRSQPHSFLLKAQFFGGPVPFRLVKPKTRRLVETLQLFPPESLGFLLVLLQYPCNVVPVKARVFHLRLKVVTIRLVKGEQLTGDRLGTPAIHHAVMSAPGEIVGLQINSNQRQPQERRLRKFKSLPTLPLKKCLPPTLLLVRRQSAPILFPQRQLHFAPHHLHWLRQPLP